MEFERQLTISTLSILKLKKPNHPLYNLDDVTLDSSVIFSSRDIMIRRSNQKQNPQLSVTRLLGVWICLGCINILIHFACKNRTISCSYAYSP